MGIFVGREREVGALDAILGEAFTAEGKLVLISGEPGIGKTRLAEELTRRAEGRDFLVCWGRSWEGEGTPAYFPWRQVVRRVVGAFGGLFDAARSETPELAGLLDARAGEAMAADPAEARFRMFDAFAELLRAASANKPIVIVLDDLHSADLSTLDLTHFVARHLRHSARVLLVGTMRDVASVAKHQAVIAKIAREASLIPLGRLGREAVAAWIGDAAPELGPSVERMHAISEGNPLFVTELIASALKRPGPSWSSAEGLPLGIREAIRAHVTVVSQATRALLEAASVLGREFSTAMLTALIGEDVAPSIDEAIAAGILVPPAASADRRLRFAHILLRDELYASVAAARRGELHRAAAGHERDPAVAAAHWLAGARPEDATIAASVVSDAMRDAIASFAFEDAAALGQRALDALALQLPEACALRIAVGEAFVLAGDMASARGAASAAADEARTLGDASLLARAALTHATDFTVGGRDEPSVVLLRDALGRLPEEDSPLRAKVMARFAVALLPAPVEEHEPALRYAREAMAMARRLGDDETTFTVLRFTRPTPSQTEDAKTRALLNAETVTLAKRLGQVPLIVALVGWQVAAQLELGDADAAAREADEMDAIFAAYRQPSYRIRPLLVKAMLADIEGRFAEADALSREARRISEENGIIAGMMLFATQRMGFLYTRGDDDGWAEFEPTVVRILDNGPLFGLFRSIFDAMCGRVDEVRRALARTTQIPLHSLPDNAGLAAACAAAGIVEHAQTFYDLVTREEAKGPWQFGPGRVTSLGPRALTLGRLALLLGRDDEAIAHLRRARDFSEQVRSRPFAAQARVELASVLAKRDPAAALAEAASGHAIARELGMRRVASHANALVDQLSADRSAKSTAAAPSRPPPSRAVPPPTTLELLREGETWRVAGLGRTVVLKDTKGLSYLEALVRVPSREIHVLELAGLRDDGDAGVVLDERAKRAYRERADALREALDEATKNGDPGHAERARSELEALTSELARAVGLGGRDRRAASVAERARINVQRRLRDVVARVRAVDAELGEHLDRSVRTGTFCVYLPTWAPTFA